MAEIFIKNRKSLISILSAEDFFITVFSSVFYRLLIKFIKSCFCLGVSVEIAFESSS